MQQSYEEFDRFIHLAVAHQRIQHASEDDVIGFEATLALHLVPEMPALLGALQIGVCLDDGTISGYRRA